MVATPVNIPRVPLSATVLTSHLYAVRGESMSPSFEPGDRLLVNWRAYGRFAPARGDAVVVRDPRDPTRRYLKRIVGLPGEELRLLEGMLFIDGDHWGEPYLGGLPASLGLDEVAWELRAGEYFVMGDNRAHSTDSREFGPIGLGLIAGKAWLRCWPLNRWGAISAGARRQQ